MSYRERKRAYFQENNCQDSFICKNCGRLITPDGAGTGHRNHCTYCLASVHLDDKPGDRAANCGGIMDAVAVWVRKNGEWAIIHRCSKCGHLGSNRIAADDSQLKLMSIALKPLANPAFPIEDMLPNDQKESANGEE